MDFFAISNTVQENKVLSFGDKKKHVKYLHV